MVFPLAGMALGGLVSGGLGLLGAGMQSKAAKEGAQDQADAARYSADLLQEQYQQNRQDMMPYMQAGYGGLGQLQGALGGLTNNYMQGGIDPQSFIDIGARGTDMASIPENYQDLTGNFNVDLAADPGYQFRLKQGQDAINQSAAAQGRFFSGDTGKALMDYGQNLASQEYGNAYNRMMGQKQFTSDEYQRALVGDMGQRGFEAQMYGLAGDQYNQDWNRDMSQRQNTYNMLSGLAGMGQGAAGQMGSQGLQTAGQMGQYNLGGAQAQAGGQQASAGAWGNALQNIGNQFMGYMGNVNQQNMFNRMYPQVQ